MINYIFNIIKMISPQDRLWMRYDQGLRMGQGSIVSPSYKYEGYMRGKMLPRGSDGRHVELENRRREQKHAENVRLIHDRPFN